MGSSAERTAVVVGAGLAGAVAARSLTELGWTVVLVERSAAPGGTSALSSGWVWRYCDPQTFAWGAPAGDPTLQQQVWRALPDALVWLERNGARVIARSTANPLTDGVRVEPAQAIEALLRRVPAEQLLLETELAGIEHRDDGRLVARLAPADLPANAAVDAGEQLLTVDAIVLAGGGYAADRGALAREFEIEPPAARWMRRHAGTSDGGTSRVAIRDLGAAMTDAGGQTYARAMADTQAPLPVADWVRLAQVYGRWSTLVSADGQINSWAEHDWADALLATALAASTEPSWLLVSSDAMARQTPYGVVRRSVGDAETAGAPVIRTRAGGMATALADAGVAMHDFLHTAAADAVAAVPVRAGLTHTVRGLRIDPDATLLDTDGQRLDGVFAAGVDAGGIADGGYASGLAQALTLGRIAAATANSR